jgi:hypothetical protein
VILNWPPMPCLIVSAASGGVCKIVSCALWEKLMSHIALCMQLEDWALGRRSYCQISRKGSRFVENLFRTSKFQFQVQHKIRDVGYDGARIADHKRCHHDC